MPETGGTDDPGTQHLPPELNTNVPQSARVYDYWLGGKDHFPADRALGEAIAGQLPTIRTQVRGQRAFLGRAVRYLVRDVGSASTWTSAPASRPPATSTTWPRSSRRSRGCCTWTTTRSCWRTPGR
jgi:S-adenosyl methyltransferase